MVAWYWIPISLILLVFANRLYLLFMLGNLKRRVAKEHSDHVHVRLPDMEPLKFRDLFSNEPELPYRAVEPEPVIVNSENYSGSTGFTPGGVSYDQGQEDAPIPKGHFKIGRQRGKFRK